MEKRRYRRYGKIIYAQIELSTGDKINLELYPDKAPETVANFVKLANSDYYVGTIFHRIIEGFVIQAGGYYIDGDTLKELPETDKIKGEFLQNGFAYNSLEHLLGTISMARLPLIIIPQLHNSLFVLLIVLP